MPGTPLAIRWQVPLHLGTGLISAWDTVFGYVGAKETRYQTGSPLCSASVLVCCLPTGTIGSTKYGVLTYKEVRTSLPSASASAKVPSGDGTANLSIKAHDKGCPLSCDCHSCTSYLYSVRMSTEKMQCTPFHLPNRRCICYHRPDAQRQFRAATHSASQSPIFGVLVPPVALPPPQRFPCDMIMKRLCAVLETMTCVCKQGTEMRRSTQQVTASLRFLTLVLFDLSSCVLHAAMRIGSFRPDMICCGLLAHSFACVDKMR